MSVIEKIKNKIQFFLNHKNEGVLFEESIQLKKIINAHLEKINPQNTFEITLKNLLIDISNSDILKIDFYKRINKNDDFWQSSINKKKWYLKQSDNNIDQNGSIINVQYFEKTIDDSDQKVKSEFIFVKIDNKSDILIEVLDRKINNFTYFNFKSEIEYFIKSYLQISEINTLIEAKNKTEDKFKKSEESVVSANKAMRRKVYELHNLVEASNDIYSILDFKQLINSSLLTIIGQIGFQKAFVLMYNKESKLFNEVHQKGFANKNINILEFDLSSPIVSYFFKNRTPVYVSKIERNKNLKEWAKKLKKLGIFIVAPLIYSERLQGILGAGEQLEFQNFTEADFEIFHVLVNIISISIGNSNLFEEIKTLSLTDAMTSLHNYRYFEDRLKEEINRASRHKKKVSLMILDIDHFKNYNDTLGHQAGDEVLRTIGKLLKQTIRDEDIVARYGGEEFCIILPGIEKKGIPVLGERVRKKIESENFFKEEVQPAGKVTISVGTATFPDDAKNFTELVDNADKALYQAKNAGRNQLKIYE